MSNNQNSTSGVQLSVLINEAKLGGQPNQIGGLLELYRNYLKLIAQTQINRRLQTRVDPSDVVQETYLDAHQGFAEFRGGTEAELIAWLRKILARNICDQAKRHGAQQRDIKREQSLEAAMNHSSMHLANALGDSITSPSCQAVKREQAVLIADAIAQLPEEQRTVITMRQMSRIPFTEIAEHLGKSPGAVRMIWLRALESLKKRVEM